MGLFDKKYCDICGEKIGLLGNKKLEDGNICKNCAGKLSPWFTGRRHSALADIKEQLAAREANQQKAADFRISKTLGLGYEKLYIDETQGLFAVCPENAWKSGNPDILPLSAVTDCVTKEDEHKTEEKYKNSEGKLVSYDPPRYELSYDFYCTISVEHPYIEEMRFRLNDSTVRNQNATFKFQRALRDYADLCKEVEDTLLQKNAPAPAPVPEAPAASSALHYHNAAGTYEKLPYFTDGIDVSVNAKYDVCYTIQDEALYSRTLSSEEKVGKQVELAIPMFYARKAAAGTTIAQLMSGMKAVSQEFLAYLRTNGYEESYGIQLVDGILASELRAEDAALLAKQALFKAQAAGVLTPEMVAAASAGVTAAASAEWTCPSCGSHNTGKFCENCGTPRS